MHARILVWVCRMIVSPQIGNDRIDLHGIHPGGAAQQGCGHIVPRTGTNHQHVLRRRQLAIGTVLVGSKVEGVF